MFVTADSIVPNAFDPQMLNRYSYCRNNPLSYVDPSGHFPWAAVAIGALIGAVTSGAQSDWNPEAMLTGAVIGGVAAGVFSGVSSVVQSNILDFATPFIDGWGNGFAGWSMAAEIGGAVAGGAAAGATAGGLGAAYYGGDIGQSALTGAGYGAAGGAAFGTIGAHYGNTWNLGRVGLHGIAGGGISELQGGDFMQGAGLSFAAASGRYLYNRIVNYDTFWESGGAAIRKDRFDMPVRGANNVGTQGLRLNPNGLFNEGGHVSRFVNHIPGINAVAGMHDVFQVSLDRSLGVIGRNLFNVPGMIPAAVITYSGLMTTNTASSIYLSTQNIKYE